MKRNLPVIILTLIGLTLSFCGGSPTRQETAKSSLKKGNGPEKNQEHRGRRADGYYHVLADGGNLQEAREMARKYILEDGLGTYVEAHSVIVDAELKQQIVSSRAGGFVYDFQVVDILRKEPAFRIHARGRVRERALAQAIKYKYARIGKPRLMILFRETVAGRESPPGGTLTEASLIAHFRDFQFVDRGELKRILARERNLEQNAYADQKSTEKALDAAARLEADFLVIGETKVTRGAPIAGTKMYSIQADVGFKIINVGNAAILAGRSNTFSVPFINVRQGAHPAIERAVEAMVPDILEQIANRWDPGRTIRVVLENITYDQYVDLELKERIVRMPRIGKVLERGRTAAGGIVLEVEALMNGPDLYRLLRKHRRELQIRLEAGEIRGGLIRIRVHPNP